ncbi:hypothetical protein R3P38DRAFT_2766380 [Favolaschia claudopus]|uniref:Protein kinase domain-containing protein n=1 Tax=Favolaschia claudopus TaxID=2862362 RepID=A0AAW0D1H0_9AGAR
MPPCPWTPSYQPQPTSVESATPEHQTSHDSEHTYHQVKEIQKALRRELDGAWVKEEGGTFQTHLERIVDSRYPLLDAQIDVWLGNYTGYSAQNRWRYIPYQPALEKELYAPFVTLLNDILTHFLLGPTSQNQQRLVVDTHRSPFIHHALDAAHEEIVKSSPDISNFGGPSATKTRNIATMMGYPAAIGLYEGKLKLTPSLNQAEREQQPSRRFVHIPLFSDEEFRVLRFDCSGCYYTNKLNYPQRAKFFVKLVVSFGSFDEDLIGYDTSIYWDWNTEKLFLRVAFPKRYDSHMKGWKVDLNPMVFDLEDQPMFSRHTIRSRGTVCWSATYHGDQYIIKDYWRADGRPSEIELLRELIRMLTFEEDRESIETGRGFPQSVGMYSDSDASRVLGRFYIRIVVRRYGDTLEKASSALQLLQAIRDIVLGHREAFLNRGILHRDISFNNLLLSPYLEDGRGVLIDWDMAKKIAAFFMTEHDSRTGTRAFQSVKVLRASNLLGHHDHLDDLESVFYVLYYVLYGFDTVGRRVPADKGAIARWEPPGKDPQDLADSKVAFLLSPALRSLAGLIERLQGFFANGRLRSVQAAFGVANPVPFPAFDRVQAEADYQTFIDFVDVALTRITSLPPTQSAPQPAPPSTHPSSSHSPKRGLDDVKPGNEDETAAANGGSPSTPHEQTTTSQYFTVDPPLALPRHRRRTMVHLSAACARRRRKENLDDDYVEGNRRKGKGKGKRS